MNQELQRALASLRDDYASIRGTPFEHFFCPILFVDEEVELCQGHVINQAFPNAHRAWTVQRKDVDGEFGSLFESEFVKIEDLRHARPDTLITERRLVRNLRPSISVDGRPVPFYRPSEDQIPAHHSSIVVDVAGEHVPLALKLDPSEALDHIDGHWTISIGYDLRLPALVSLLKAAHLALFRTVGYAYALSASGHFMGHEVLGKFYRRSRGLTRDAQIELAFRHFSEFSAMVRPLRSEPSTFGTLQDGYLQICLEQGKPWAFLVLIRAGSDWHAVLIPVLESTEAAVRFASFLQQPAQHIEVQLARFNDGVWQVGHDTGWIEWPVG